MLVLATESGVLTVSERGEVEQPALEDYRTVAVAPVGEQIAVAVDEAGVLIGSGDTWEDAGLGGKIIWTLSSVGNVLYAGLEPAAILRREPSGTWTELSALSLVDGYADWHRGGCHLPATWDQLVASFASDMGPPLLPVMGPP